MVRRVVAFALLAWVLTRASTTLVGGFGYGFLFGLAFYIPLLPWIGELVGAGALAGARCRAAVFPGAVRPAGGRGAAAARLADLVRRAVGAAEWLKSTVPFGGFPWGVVGFGQTDGPLLPLVQLGGVPLLSFAVALLGFSLAALAFEIVALVAARPGRSSSTAAPPAVVLPGVVHLPGAARDRGAWPQVRQSGAGAGDEPAITVAAVQGNVPRLGLDFNAQRRAVLDNHVRETLGWPTTCAPGGRRNRSSSSGRRTRRTSIRWPTPTPRNRSRSRRRRSARRSWSAACVAAPGYTPGQPGVDEHRDRLGSRHRPG